MMEGFEATFYSGGTSTFYGGQAIIEGQDPIDLNGSEFILFRCKYGRYLGWFSRIWSPISSSGYSYHDS